MPQHTVCLSFDFDAMSGLVARGLTTPTPVSRGEFGAVAVDRILAVLERYGVPASWFVPGTVVKTYPDHCRRIAAAAGVDPALVMYFFGSKQQLFLASIELLVDPAAAIPRNRKTDFKRSITRVLS